MAPSDITVRINSIALLPGKVSIFGAEAFKSPRSVVRRGPVCSRHSIGICIIWDDVERAVLVERTSHRVRNVLPHAVSNLSPCCKAMAEC